MRKYTRRRRCGNVGPDAVGIQARWKEWETRLGSFPRFPRGVISTAIFLPAEGRLQNLFPQEVKQ